MAKLAMRDYLELLKLLRLDVYFMLALIGSAMPSITINQLAQDKYCLNSFSVNESSCLNLENAGAELESVRNKVLEKATTLKMYTTIITTIPGVISSLFFGYWIDTYPGHLRWILTLGPIGVLIQNLMIIYQCINFNTAPMALLYTYTIPALTSSIVMTGAYTYATVKTPPKYRTVRFMIMEIFVFAALPVSSVLGGILLGMKPWFSNQLRNYIGVFIVSTFCSSISLIWAIVTIRNTEHTNDDDKNAEIGEDTVEREGPNTIRNQTNKNDLKKKNIREIIIEILTFRNVFCTLKTAFKPRANNQRAALLITMISMVICMIGYMGESAIGLQYAQRVYHWTSEYYSYMGSTTIILPALATVITPPLLIHKFNLHDISIGVLGSISLTIAMLIKGLFLSVPAFFVSIISGSFIGLLPIANRSVVARIILKSEIGQIYALLSSIEPIGPLISSILYTTIFNATIDDAPGTVYIVIGLIVTFPACVTVWLYYTRHQWDQVLLEEAAAKKKSVQSQSNSEDNILVNGQPLVRNISYRRDSNSIHISEENSNNEL